jgi:hypothetical protein
MEPRIKKFLEFNGKVLYFVSKDGIYWIAIRPICDVLGIDYSNELRRIKKHSILGSNVVKSTMVDAQNRLFQMASLPEKYIYGWLFTVSSEKATCQEFQQKCYDLLYEYFHGSITGRHETLLEKSDSLAKIDKLEAELSEDPRYIELNNEKARVMRLGKQLKEQDDDFIMGQLTLQFHQDN